MINILVVDEERSIRQAIKFELENEGFFVIDVNDLADALSAFKAFKCDLVIADISEKNGFGQYLLKHIHGIPFIALSSVSFSGISNRAQSVLQDNFLKSLFRLVN